MGIYRSVKETYFGKCKDLVFVIVVDKCYKGICFERDAVVVFRFTGAAVYFLFRL